MTLIKCETCINGLLPSGHQCPECDGTGQVEREQLDCEPNSCDENCRGCILREQMAHYAEWKAGKKIRKRNEAEALAAHIAADCPDDGVVCRKCCEHEYDWDEGGMCLNCGDQGDYGALIDHAMDTYGGDR